MGMDDVPLPTFETYEPKVAAGILSGESAMLTGLPAYLGVRTVDIGPGTMIAELDIRPELLNPFGTAHGGVLAALVDHVLGAVLYPVIPRGAWAATTEFKLNLLAPVRDGVVQARSRVMSMTKEVAWSQLEIGSLQAGIDLENRTQILSSLTEDSREAMTAFLEKRPADFRGR